jgi:hypothetical protein
MRENEEGGREDAPLMLWPQVVKWLDSALYSSKEREKTKIGN